MAGMPEQTSEKNTERDLAYSYHEYVDALVDRLQITADTDRLYADSAMDLKPWLDAVQFSKDEKPVDASFFIGPSTIYKAGTSTVHLRSDDTLPKNAIELKYGPKRLAAYALAEAKLRFLDKRFEDLPALRGFKLQFEIASIHSEVNFYEHNAYWEVKKPLRKKIYAAIGALGLAAIACGFNFGTGEIPTAPPTAAGEVQPSVEMAIIVTDENGDQYSVNEGRTFTSEPYYGYLINYETNTGTETLNRFQFARADVQNTEDPSKTDFVTLFQQVDAYGNPTAELFLVETNTPGVYELIDQYNNRPGYSLIMEGDRVIFRVKEGDIVSDYLISKKLTPSADGSTPVATQSPEDLRADIAGMHKVQSIILKEAVATLPPASPTPTETPIPTPTLNGNVEDEELGVSFEVHTPPGGIMLVDSDLAIWDIGYNWLPLTVEVDTRLGWNTNLAYNPKEENIITQELKGATFSSDIMDQFASWFDFAIDTKEGYDDTMEKVNGFYNNGDTVRITIADQIFYWSPRDGYMSRLVQEGTLDPNDPLVFVTNGTSWKIEVVDNKLVSTIEVSDLDSMSDNDKLELIFAPLGEVLLYKGVMPEKIKSFSGSPDDMPMKNARMFATRAGGTLIIDNTEMFGPIMFVPRSDLNSPSPTPTPSPSAKRDMVVAGN